MDQSVSGELAVGVDIGGTHMRAGVVDGSGAVLARLRCATPQESRGARLVSQLAAMVSELFDGLGGAIPVGIGIAGVVASDGTFRYGPNLAMRDVALGPALREQFRIPVVVANDGTVAAFAEQQVGAGRGAANLLLVTIGTGIGAGIVLDGRPAVGAHAMAAELGHVIVVPGGRTCGCGNRGCVEAYASGTALSAIASEQRSGFAVEPRTNDDGQVTASGLVVAASSGDELSERLLVDATRYLGQAIAAATNLLDPEYVVFGGGLAQAIWPWISREVPNVFADHVFAARQRELPGLAMAALTDDAGIVGAALMAQGLAATG